MTHNAIKCYPGGMDASEATAMLYQLRHTLKVVHDTMPLIAEESLHHIATQRAILNAISLLCTFRVHIEDE